MAQDGNTREAAEEALAAGAFSRVEKSETHSDAPPAEPGPQDSPPPLPKFTTLERPPPMPKPGPGSSPAHVPEPGTTRRPARRRPAGPARPRIGAGDEAPTIGGLIFALQQKPSNRPFQLAAGASGVWVAVGSMFGWAMLAPEFPAATGLGDLLARPVMLVVAATMLLPIALFWFLALLVWRAQELKLMSSAMTEVAVRLAEPDRTAEQAAATLGQAVRRQVAFMNEAISRALGRAGELEALVHNEVASLERSYSDNENRIRGLLKELQSERDSLINTTGSVSETLKAMGSEVPALIEKLSQQQIKLAKIIESAGQNLIALENQLVKASGTLESQLAERTQQLQAVLDDYTTALDATLAARAEALNEQLLERTRALDAAFAERLLQFDESLLRSAIAIDSAVNEKARALTTAMENHVRTLSDTLGRQASDLDETLMHGVDAVRRTSDSITRQSVKAIEGLSSQADMLRRVSEKLAQQMAGVTNRFSRQGESMLRAASQIESANERIDATLQRRHEELAETLQRLSGKAEQFDQVVRGYSSTLESSLAQAEEQTTRALEDLGSKFSGVSQDVAQQLGSISSRFGETSEELKERASRAAAELLREQERLRAEAERLPVAARESADTMRRALSDQLRALEQLSRLSARESGRRDIIPPGPLPEDAPVSLTAAYAAQSASSYRAASNRNRWSLGDLLARASREDGPPINVDVIAGALDPVTASAIWSRLRTGQRGIMVRTMYTPEGRAAFDEIAQRYKTDPEFHRTVDRFLGDFEWLLRDIGQRDPSGRAMNEQMISDAGRVYLFLAHASGRLS
jgi:DNA anti-recombination protein RmuC